MTTNGELWICTTDPDFHASVATEMSKMWRGAVKMVALQTDTLRHYRFESTCSHAPVIVLCHMCEGRTLLTDRDGLYNSFLVEAAKISRGNLYVGLSGCVAKSSGEAGVLADESVAAELVRRGQASMGVVHAARRLLTWNEKPSQAQVRHIVNDLAPPFPEDLPLRRRRLNHRGRGTSALFCQILSIL